MNPADDAEKLKIACRQISESFDTVHIFATRYEPGKLGGTASWNEGVGNWYAREGQIREWIQIQDECARIKARIYWKESGE